MYSLVDVERGLLREPLHAQIAFERSFTSVHSHVDVEVRFAAERRRTLQALEWPSLHCARIVVCSVCLVWGIFGVFGGSYMFGVGCGGIYGTDIGLVGRARVC